MAIYPEIPNEWLQSQAPDIAKANNRVRFEGVEINESGQLVNIPVVYGLRRITPPRVLTTVQNSNSNILYCVYAVCDGRISKFDKIVIDDFPVNIDGITNGTRFVISTGAYATVMEIQPFFGVGTNVISTLLAESTGRQDDFRLFTESLNGMAYCVVKMTLVPGSTPYKQLPNISFDVCGRLLRPANTLGTAVQVLSDANPADVLVDYLTNTTYGRGLADSKLDTSSLGTMRSSFNTLVTPYTNGAQIKRLVCNYVLDTGRSVLDNVREICRQFGIIMTLANGKYRFIAETVGSSFIITANQSNLVGSYSETIPDLSVKYNTVTVVFPDANLAYTDNSATVIDNDGVIDDGKILNLDIRYDALTDPYRSRFAAQQLMQKSRNQRVYRFTLTKIALQLTVGDLILWDPDNTGVSNRLLRIVSLSLNRDFTFEVEAVTHNNSFYPPFTPSSAIPPRPELNYTNSGTVSNLASFGLSEPVTIVYPVVPQGVETKTVTVTVSKKPGWTAEPPKLTGGLGDLFYMAPIRRENPTVTTITDLNYFIDNLNFSIRNDYNNFGVDARVIPNKISTVFYPFAQWGFFLFYRNRSSTRQGGEGLFEFGSRTYDKIYYVYEVGVVNDGPVYGAYNQLDRTTYETIYFDPEAGLRDARYQRGTSPVTNRTIAEVLDPDFKNPLSLAKIGCPALGINADGYYDVSNGVTDYYLSYYIKTNQGTTKPYQIPNVVYSRKQGFAAGSSSQLMTLKFFVLKSDGFPVFIGSRRINIDDERFADSGITLVTSNRSAWEKSGLTAPF